MRTRIFYLGLLTLMSASLASATPITLPSGLNPGDTYFLAFVTAGSRDATSSNIADYDAFVSLQANSDPLLAALGTTWKAIGSTETVNAVTHIGVTGPVYNLQGQLVDTGSSDMFDGNINAPIVFDQDGIQIQQRVWTGSDFAGNKLVGNAIGDRTAMTGISGFSDVRWIDVVIDTNLDQWGVYGISGPLLVPTTVPEPSTISLMLGPLLLLGSSHRWWRDRRATPMTPSDPASH